ncbi:uncharacterized protein LOC141912944 [Tubulanus polymorphus]|uniref:uncharacterized protein LOC141912944 n=1 Tax=Tubulanus polymorphus TaxID=672921 RepID=UPI003DA20179
MFGWLITPVNISCYGFNIGDYCYSCGILFVINVVICYRAVCNYSQYLKMTSTLTKSAVKRLLQGEKLKNPTVQVLQNHVPLYNCDKSKEWAIEISDGKNSHIALINSDLRKRWRNDPSVKSFIIVKLKRYDQLMVEYCRERMLTVLDYEIIDSTLTSKYGNPVGCKLRFVLAVQETKGKDGVSTRVGSLKTVEI